MSAAAAAEWKLHFVAYEDALASFYSLQDATQATLEHSYAIRRHIGRLTTLRLPILAARRELRTAPDGGRVAEIERERATIELDGLSCDVTDLVANRVGADNTVLELSFRVDPKSIPRFMKLTGSIRIRFPFGESTFVAACRLVRFRMVRDEFAFRFAVVDPI